jgi:predicted ester cyclase
MPRHVAIVALGLMLLTGIVIGQLHTLGVDQPTIVAATDTSDTNTAGRFYERVNRFLADGEEEPLRDVLQPEFIDHSGSASADGSADDLLRYLSSLRNTFPGLRFRVTGLLAQGDSVAAYVSTAGDTAGQFAGVEVAAPGDGEGFEVLRVEAGKIAERWGSLGLPPLFETVLEVDGPPDTASLVEPAFERRILEPNGQFTMENELGGVLVAEKGSISLSVEGVAEPRPGSVEVASSVTTPISAEETTRLQPGESLSMPAGRWFRIWNSGADESSFLMLSLSRSNPGDFGFPAPDLDAPNVEREVLAPSGQLRSHHGPYTISIGRAVLPVDATIPAHRTGEWELVTVIRGTIEAEASGGFTWILRGDASQTFRGAVSVPAGKGVTANEGAEISYQVAGSEPAEIWLITMRQQDGDEVRLRPETYFSPIA